MQIATVFSAVSILAKSIGSLPVVLSKRTPKGKLPVPEHPLQYLLGSAPNDESPSAVAFWESYVGHLVLTGNAYAEIQRNGAGDPTALWILDPRQTQPWREPNGELVYKTTQGGQARTLAAADVLHVPLYSHDGIFGLSPITQCRELLGTTVATERFGARFFRNYATPSLVLKTDAQVLPEQKTDMRNAWERMQSGNNAHRIAILDQGLSIEKISIAPDEAQWMESQKHNRSTIAAIFGVPLHLLGDDSKLSRASTEEVNRQFYTDTLQPLIARITSAIALKILPRSPGCASDYSVDFDSSARLQGDENAQMNRVTTLRQWGITTINEQREALGYPSLGLGGNRLLTPANMNAVDADTGEVIAAAPPVVTNEPKEEGTPGN